MIVLQQDERFLQEMSDTTCLLDFHPSFRLVYKKIQKWLDRFPAIVDNAVLNDLFLLYLLGTKEFLDHRNISHLVRLVVSVHLLQKRLLRTVTFAPHVRRIEIRWLPTNLSFPFFSKPVWGCLIGCNMMGRYELFDEENIKLALQKHLPEFRVVKESSYCHTGQHKNLKLFYLEIEKKDGSVFSFQEQNLLKVSLGKKIKKSIESLTPGVFRGLNEEEIYKNILVLNQEIQSVQDLPQAYITLDQQTGEEIVFRIALVYVTPFHRFLLKERFFDCSFVSERVMTVKHLENRPVEGHVFRLHLLRTNNLLRSDGSLDFYAARKKVVSLIVTAIGEFRDYNGGILLKQQELFQHFKDNFSDLANYDSELMENFFYELAPLEKQASMPEQVLFSLFAHFLQNRFEQLSPDCPYALKIHRQSTEILLCVYSEDLSIKDVISALLQDTLFRLPEMIYNTIVIEDRFFFNCSLLSSQTTETAAFIQGLQEYLHKWHQKIKDQQVLRIGLEHLIVSLDPRIGGDDSSGSILRLLFEGLTRLDQQGNIENAVAEAITISPNLLEYTFKLRYAQWNDGSPISAHDFEYAWKKILSPDFNTSFAYRFYPIHNAKKAKEGKVPLDRVGIHVIDDRTLKVVLERPSLHFLQLIAHPVFSPVHRLMDQEHPQWPFQSQKNYPCNGPFQLKINHPSQGYHLIRNPFYSDPRPPSWDQVIMTRVTPLQAIQGFQKKEIDWIGNPFGSWHPSYIAGKDDTLLSFPRSLVYWCVFNTMHPVFSHKKLRQAFAFVINRNEIITNSFLPLTPAYSPLFSSYSTDNHALFPTLDIEKAQLLFNEALKELGLSLENFPPINLIFHQKGIGECTALSLKQQFKDNFGIECNLKPFLWGDLFNKLSDGDFQIALVHWTSWIDDPIYTLNSFKHANEKINLANWENSAFCRLLDLSDEAVNPFQRSSYLLQAEGILSQEVPIVPLFYQPSQSLVRKDLNIFYRSPCGPFNLARSFNKKKEEY